MYFHYRANLQVGNKSHNLALQGYKGKSHNQFCPLEHNEDGYTLQG